RHPPHGERPAPPRRAARAPRTPPRPAAALTGTRPSPHTRSPAATSPTAAGRATAAARAATFASRAQIIASGHQSRLASAIVMSSTVTSPHAERSRPSTASSIATAGAARCPRTASGGPPNAIGAVGCPVAPTELALAGRGVEAGLGQAGRVALGGHGSPVLLDLPGSLGVVPAELAADQHGDVVGGGGRVVPGEQARPCPPGEHVV